MLVVIGVTGLLSGMVILYGGSGRRLVSLSVEAAKIAQVIQRAKAASVLVEYRPAEPVCGYGVHLAYAERRYTFFRYLASTLEDCNTISNIDAGYDEINSFSLPKGIVFKDASDGISDILFIPPDPRTLLFRSTARVNGNYKILLASEDGTLEHAVGINSGGQVSF
ncbi:MAG: hypothetical protein A2946_02330 [Candidatus Liptonbacteria bacterium RIFCSPLOWO2_01_FULL_53_13]|uniref:General secretion pathway GspH domain-containing protein n=1 Tax=Candidatus Liptonbacteria bacterium RIFCSPLOWO2_01_FULL_53_13 TaxID=1798651 RepID=A0A1G2CGN0_9BACT|nr:MAG: hypothetical protein A2946_02330 [Candidatus Liptonbacteria bacterium RIFCSPLOWO2_01_FULL_53_13]